MESLSGIVYAITEIPVDLIRAIVDASVAESLNGTGPEPATAPANPPTEPDWNLVRRHYRCYGDPAKTAEKYGVHLYDVSNGSPIYRTSHNRESADTIGTDELLPIPLMRRVLRMVQITCLVGTYEFGGGGQSDHRAECVR